MDDRETIVRQTLSHILQIIRTAGEGAERADHVTAQAFRGMGDALSKKADEIVAEVLKQLL